MVRPPNKLQIKLTSLLHITQDILYGVPSSCVKPVQQYCIFYVTLLVSFFNLENNIKNKEKYSTIYISILPSVSNNNSF